MINSRRTAFAARRFPVKLGFIGLSRSVILSVVLRAANQNLPLAGGKRTITNA